MKRTAEIRGESRRTAETTEGGDAQDQTVGKLQQVSQLSWHFISFVFFKSTKVAAVRRNGKQRVNERHGGCLCRLKAFIFISIAFEKDMW